MQIWGCAGRAKRRRRFGSSQLRPLNHPKRRRRFALPAHSKAYCLVPLPFALEDSGLGAL